MAGTGMWSLIAVFVVIIGGIFAGLFTPTEAGGAGAFVVLVIALARRRLSWQRFKTTLRDAGVTVGMVGFLLIGTLVFNTFLVVTGVPASIATFIGGITDSPLGVIWIIMAIFFLLLHFHRLYIPLFDIFRGVAPFLIAIMACLALVVFFPQISLFLPRLMMG